jgi:CBS domain-containing protein
VVNNGRLIGMFTTTDALRARQEGKAQVGDAMSTDVLVAYPSDSLHTALQRMTRSGVSRLPVVERERPDELVGILTTRDLAAALDLQVSAFAERPAARETASEADPLRSVLVREAMSREFVTVPESLSVRRVAHRLAAKGHHAALLVNEEGALTGIVTLRDLEQAANDNPDRPIREVATRSVVVARPTQSIAEALAQPGAEALRQLPVLEEQGDRRALVGLLSRSDVLAAYLHARDRRTRIARRAKSLATEHGGDVVTLELAIGPSDPVVGRSLAEVGLPRDSVVTSVLRDGRLIIPRGQVRLQPGDQLQVLASAVARDAILALLASPGKSADDARVSPEKPRDEDQ